MLIEILDGVVPHRVLFTTDDDVQAPPGVDVVGTWPELFALWLGDGGPGA